MKKTTGKTKIIKKLSKRKGLKYTKIKLVKINPEDYKGFPIISNGN